MVGEDNKFKQFFCRLPVQIYREDEMAKRILVVAVILLLVGGAAMAQTFSDVPKNHWAHDAVEKAARLGLVVGRGDGFSEYVENILLNLTPQYQYYVFRKTLP